MRAPRARINRATAERLLAGGGVGPQHHKLATLLATVAAPTTGPAQPTGGAITAKATEAVARAAGASAAGGGGASAASGVAGQALLPGEAAAMAAFRAVVLDSRRRRRSVIANFLTIKVAMGAATAVAAGGVALAATNGTLPNPLTDQAAPQASAATDKAHDSHGKAGSPSPSLVGLCKAYAARVGDNEQGKALDNPAFKALISAAGSTDKVTSYCDDLLASSDKAKGNSAPTQRPTNAPTERASKPDAPEAPTTAPTDRPTGAPTSRAGN